MPPEKDRNMSWTSKVLSVCGIVFGISIAGMTFMGCAPEKTERSTAVMGTVLTVTVYGLSSDAAAEAVDSVYGEMERLNNLLSVWDSESTLSRLNRAAAVGWVEADPEILGLISASLHYSELSGGAFDVTAGPLVRLWGFLRRGDQRPPTDAELAEAKARIGFRKVELDRGRSMVRFGADGMEIDFGGVAKGYAVDSAIELLREQGVESALVNLGGNSRAIGSPPGRGTWRISVRDPRKREGTLGVLEILGQGVASSGQYENYFEYEGKLYGHIIDPRSGYTVEGVLGTTIVAPDAIAADILSTTVFVLGPEKGPELVNALEDVEGIIILPRGDAGILIMVSKGLEDALKLDPAVADATVETF